MGTRKTLHYFTRAVKTVQMQLLPTPSITLPSFHHRSPRKAPTFLPKSMDWTCPKCTFLNPASQKSTCQICLSTSSLSYSPPSSSSAPTAGKWSCKACTFLNPYRNTSCEVCGTRASSLSLLTLQDDELDSSVGSVFFPLQPSKTDNRETPNEINSSVRSFFMPLQPCNSKKVRETPTEIADDYVESSGSAFSPLQPCKKESRETPIHSANKSAFLPLQPCKRKRETPIENADDFFEPGGFREVKSANKAVASSGETFLASASRTLKIMSYNVWFREDLELRNRMKALGGLIRLHSPDVICFQEVTPDIYDIFQQSGWWKVYSCSVSNDTSHTRPYFCMQLSKLPVKSYSCKPFSNSIMGRELCVAEVEVGADMPLVVATSHLESPCPGPPKWDQMFSKERVDQAKEAVNFLKSNPNVIFCGDMNWDDKLDGQFPFLDGWVDAWVQLKPGENGWTYDTKSNKMLSGNRTLQKRLDRFVCNLPDFKIRGIDMIGMEAIPELSYIKEKKVKQEVKKLELPVLPSDHYGLILTISTRQS